MGRVESKIPLLGDIPILGAAFRSKSFREQKTELLIFITTRVVTTSDEMRRMTVDQIDDSTYYDQRAREFFSDAHPVRDAVEFMERNIGQ
jgi:type II secretory pathway component GspD/PulD (secretin)